MGEESCLKFNERESTVKTFSRLQVRNPINTGSVGRWRNYEKHLGPILGILRRQDISVHEASSDARGCIKSDRSIAGCQPLMQLSTGCAARADHALLQEVCEHRNPARVVWESRGQD